MDTVLYIVIGVIVVGLIAWRFMIPSMDAFIAKAREQDDIAPIVDAVEKMSESSRPTAYNHAIRKLWDDYQRPLAIELIKELARKHDSSLISQYWLGQALKVEPELATKQISQEFQKRHYRPDVASQCGSFG